MSDTMLSTEAFWKRYAGQSYELVSGKLVTLRPSVGGKASEVAIAVAAELYNFNKKARAGRVTGADGAYALASNCLRVPDVGFYSNAKAARILDPQKFLPFAPDLAVEVVAPNESACDLMEKVSQYVAAGTALVWAVYPELRVVVVHYPNTTSKTFTSAGVLDGGNILPRLQIAVADLFPTPEELL
jgi:Uma2 family endonuclease